MVIVLCETCHQICPFSVASLRPPLQELLRHLSHILFANGRCQWRLVVSFRVGLVDSYRIRRSGRTERGVRAYSPSWSELPSRNWSVRRGMRNRGHNSGVTPVNRKAGMRGSTREPPGETPGIFKPHRVSPPLIWASDSVMLVRGGAYGKRFWRGLMLSSLSIFLASPRKFLIHP